MSIYLGTTNIGRIYHGGTEISDVYLGSVHLFSSGVDPYNPLGLPQYTIRARFSTTPTGNSGFSGTITHVSGDIYDIQTDTNSWASLFGAPLLGSPKISVPPTEILGGNCAGVTSLSTAFKGCSSITSMPLMDTRSVTVLSNAFNGCSSLVSVANLPLGSVTNMVSAFANCSALVSVPNFTTTSVTNTSYMFRNCTSLTTAPSINTYNVQDMSHMFDGCTSLTAVPLYDTHSVTNMESTFNGCTSVASGALSLYTQASSQINVPTNHTDTFKNCGTNTTTGLAELNQIPSAWGGLYTPAGISYTFEKYYYSAAQTDTAAYSTRALSGYLAGAVWVPSSGAALPGGTLRSFTTPQTAQSMRVNPVSKFYRWNTATTQSSTRAVKFGMFAVPKANLSRQNVYDTDYGWKSSTEPQFLYQIASVGNAPSYSYSTYTPPANTEFTISSDNPTIPSGSALILCLYIYSGGNYYFGTVARTSYGYLPYSSNNDLVLSLG